MSSDTQRAAALVAMLDTAERYAERTEQPPADAEQPIPAWIAFLIGLAALAALIAVAASLSYPA